MTEPEELRIKDLAIKIRAKEEGATSLFLAMWELYPATVWTEAVNGGLLSERELQACLLALKQYRKIQAKSAVRRALVD